MNAWFEFNWIYTSFEYSLKARFLTDWLKTCSHHLNWLSPLDPIVSVNVMWRERHNIVCRRLFSTLLWWRGVWSRRQCRSLSKTMIECFGDKHTYVWGEQYSSAQHYWPRWWWCGLNTTMTMRDRYTQRWQQRNS